MSTPSHDDLTRHTIILRYASKLCPDGTTVVSRAVEVEYPGHEAPSRVFRSVFDASKELGVEEPDIVDGIERRVPLETIFPIRSVQDQSSKSWPARHGTW